MSSGYALIPALRLSRYQVCKVCEQMRPPLTVIRGNYIALNFQQHCVDILLIIIVIHLFVIINYRCRFTGTGQTDAPRKLYMLFSRKSSE